VGLVEIHIRVRAHRSNRVFRSTGEDGFNAVSEWIKSTLDESTV
jgi:hypothetical protein